MTNYTTNTSTASAVTLESIVKVVQAAADRNAELDRKVFRFDGTLDELSRMLRAAGVVVGADDGGKYPTYDVTPPALNYGLIRATLEVWRVAGSFWIGTPKALERLAKGPTFDPAPGGR